MGALFSCFASAAFGLEGLVAEELRILGMRDVSAENGGVRFLADTGELLTCNISMRFCDRIMIVLAEHICYSFEDLFQLVSSVPWELYAEGREAFHVSAKCARSRLMSPRDCQSVSKKAILERLKSHASIRIFPEDGAVFPVHISVHTDKVRILLNTSGDALSRRGYRTWNGEAPLRETLAAALVRLSPWKPGMPLYDPCCGTGTILAEAAFMASKRQPGIDRAFAMEQFYFCRNLDSWSIREDLQRQTNFSRIGHISGSDIDPSAVDLAGRHMKQAGLANFVSLSVRPLQEVVADDPYGVFICNPPYGERLSDQNKCRMLYHGLFLLKQRHPTWRLCAISSDPAFERSFGKKASRKRRLYNGRLECVYYIYD